MAYLKPGTRVRVVRINGESVAGVIRKGPIKHLLAIGEFYQIRHPLNVFAGNKNMTTDIGMYGREQITEEKA